MLSVIFIITVILTKELVMATEQCSKYQFKLRLKRIVAFCIRIFTQLLSEYSNIRCKVSLL